MRIPEPLISKSGLTRTATFGRIPSSWPISISRRASVLDSISTVTPDATAWRNSAGVLPGPAKLIRSGRIVVFMAVRSSRAEATSKASTSPLRWWTTAGMGLALIA